MKRNRTLIAQWKLEMMCLFSLVLSVGSLQSVWYGWVGLCSIMRCLHLMWLLHLFSNSLIRSWDTEECKIHAVVYFPQNMDLIPTLKICFRLSLSTVSWDKMSTYWLRYLFAMIIKSANSCKTNIKGPSTQEQCFINISVFFCLIHASTWDWYILRSN